MVKKTKNLEFYEGIGRRKQAVARVRLYLMGKNKEITVGHTKIKLGEIYINNNTFEKVYSRYHREFIFSPLKLTGNENRFAISIKTSGGGKNGQLEAIVHGISRSLSKVDENYRSALKKNGFLTRDPRKKERRKVGTGGKARRAKQSPKR
ncbi:MAG: 30S ribosomal protein S9 [Candidatus Roizmanbacteria bacterium GW2011_GWC2_37_13]|uniref:30S ribosomal protein S9 n=1 Tax=Candidatus Roizmanbacteria bacterium GW2011_GWC2_37_13 TaxID=1618486 RepID=A0A0G0G6A3_9BACT|nr:MAG: 30S ribosomal protein S9, small subunit ribosomal protein S9 [Candidatus Roizmanbacteria bacterium GW2011_GWC1_37_12]KKQ26613.1 MAG: 30S ribosomal protein S9 [Candidatus Roizmanbacteria bacterium GW2011_GWC2_37_13]